jgi:hypothetical protein
VIDEENGPHRQVCGHQAVEIFHWGSSLPPWRAALQKSRTNQLQIPRVVRDRTAVVDSLGMTKQQTPLSI